MGQRHPFFKNHWLSSYGLLSGLCLSVWTLAASGCNERNNSNDNGSNGDNDGVVTEPAGSGDDDDDNDNDDDGGTQEHTGDIDPSSGACATIHAIIRDFSTGHPDFQTYEGDFATPGLVQNKLGKDGKPVYAPAGGTSQTTSRADFDQWYNDTPGINHHFEFDFTMRTVGANVCSYTNNKFFPIDGKGFGSEGLVDRDGIEHNFLFTTEIHTSFVYRKGQVFTFVGDDDLWMFVNGSLVIDLGGLHPALEKSVNLDTLGLELGQAYTMDIFHAERHTTDSNFRIDTNIEFIPPD